MRPSAPFIGAVNASLVLALFRAVVPCAGLAFDFFCARLRVAARLAIGHLVWRDGSITVVWKVAIRPQPLIAVADVESSSRWYQRLLGCRSAHGGPEYERLVAHGVLILQLHRFEVEHHHLPIGNPADKPYGNGVLLWFEVDDFDAAVGRAEALNAEINSHFLTPDYS